MIKNRAAELYHGQTVGPMTGFGMMEKWTELEYIVRKMEKKDTANGKQERKKNGLIKENT